MSPALHLGAERVLVIEDEPDLASYPRLVFRFNRRSLGRLRLLIDVINRGSIGS